MVKKEITLHFDLEDGIQNRVYFALIKLPMFLCEPNLSKAIILFINCIVCSIIEKEERTVQSEEGLKQPFGQNVIGRD
jgi:hypothetical protein